MSRFLNSILFVILMTVLMSTTCVKEDYTPAPKQDFWEKVELTPYQKVYNMGDTIWLHYHTNDKTFFDTLSNQRLASSALKYVFGATLLPKYQTPENLTGGFCTFLTPAGLPVRYVSNESGTTTSFDVDCDASSYYDIKIGVVLIQTGTYVLDLPDAIFLTACDGQTNPYPNSHLHFTYNLPDCNKDIYLTIPAENRQEYPVGFSATRIDLKASYAFQVN